MKKIIIRVLFLFLLGCTFFTIFQFSAQDGETSESISRKVVQKLINVFPSTKDLSLETKTKLIEYVDPIVRKLAHFSIYTAVGVFIMSFMSTFQNRLYQKWLISMGVGLLYAISDEYHQSFVDSREPSIIDVGIDTTGVLFGILIVLVIISIYQALTRDRRKLEIK